MLDVNVQKNGDYSTVNITDGEKVFVMTFGGNLDLHWNIYSIDKIDKEKTISIDITKDNYVLWELFDKLYNDIKNCNIFEVDDVTLSFCEDSDEVRELYEKYESHNAYIKKSEIYRNVFDGNCVRWLSDDESYNVVTIAPDEDRYIIEFASGIKISYLERYGVRFRNSGSMHDPFNQLFMKLYNKIISGEHDFNQIHMNEYIRKLKKHS